MPEIGGPTLDDFEPVYADDGTRVPQTAEEEQLIKEAEGAGENPHNRELTVEAGEGSSEAPAADAETSEDEGEGVEDEESSDENAEGDDTESENDGVMTEAEEGELPEGLAGTTEN